MISPEMEFHCYNTDIVMYIDDNGMYRVVKSFTDKPGGSILIGRVLERDDASWLFSHETAKLVRQWELTVD